jgi:beta-fructofuranosidase
VTARALTVVITMLSKITSVLLTTLVFSTLGLVSNAAFELDSNVASFDLLPRQSVNLSQTCSLDQSKPPGNLTFCGNSTLFAIWRPKARFIAPEGWMNDPQGMLSIVFSFIICSLRAARSPGLFQRKDGSIHVGYQCHPQHYTVRAICSCSSFLYF